MTSFFLGFLISAVAALPSLLFFKAKVTAEFKHRIRLWAIGIAIRFGIIGAGLYYLFTQTPHPRIPAIAGVLVAYFISFFIETFLAYRSQK
jgi:hypothetical protein